MAGQPSKNKSNVANTTKNGKKTAGWEVRAEDVPSSFSHEASLSSTPRGTNVKQKAIRVSADVGMRRLSKTPKLEPDAVRYYEVSSLYNMRRVRQPVADPTEG